MSRQTVGFHNPDQPTILEDSDDEMITGEGRIATPTKDPRKPQAVQKSIKAQTNYQLHDPALYDKKNLRVKTNKKLFRPIKTPEDERATPQSKNSACFQIMMTLIIV